MAIEQGCSSSSTRKLLPHLVLLFVSLIIPVAGVGRAVEGGSTGGYVQDTSYDQRPMTSLLVSAAAAIQIQGTYVNYHDLLRCTMHACWKKNVPCAGHSLFQLQSNSLSPFVQVDFSSLFPYATPPTPCIIICIAYTALLAISLSVSWNFDSSAEAWARASSVEMDAEVQWKPLGTIRGTVRGPTPHLDSPGFRVLATDRHYVVVRMRSSGAGKYYERTRVRVKVHTDRHLIAAAARQRRANYPHSNWFILKERATHFVLRYYRMPMSEHFQHNAARRMRG